VPCYAALSVMLEVVYARLLVLAGLTQQDYGQHYVVAANFLQAFTAAALFEETAKYLVIRRLSRSPLAVDAYSLLVYSACTGK